MTKPKSTSWGGVAEWYDALLEGNGTYQKEVILPNLLRRMGIKKGESVLDLACGQGFFSQEFSRLGARVTGVDVSPELIRIAERKFPSISFHASPADRLPFVKDKSVDKIAVVMAIQNIADVAAAFRECARVLKREGSLHLVMNHPSFRVPKASDWAWDDATKTQFRRVDKYLGEFKTFIQMHPGDSPGETTVSFHRPLQYYAKHLAKSGFCITGLEEWVSHKTSTSGPRAAAENRARAEIPLFLYLEARKSA